ncbi:UNVERIFIED_CONTAM: hypothetical protein RMT77_003231 [Armadillidium vulgare]
MERIIDMRSDTVTLPTKEMKQTMLTAPLGDDVFGEDPTVNALQKKVATLLGKEDALFVPSGTMANLICVLGHCWSRGAEVILGDQTHIFLFEQGGIAQLGGVHPRPLPNLPDGTFSIELMETVFRDNNIHFPVTSLVCIENTHNLIGGKALPLKWVDEVGRKCKELGVPLHVDGARLFNASVLLNVPPERLVRDASSVSICVSKGLGAPVGSVIAASHEFIERAKRLRKVLGGGMRQSGVLASMGIYAIDHATETIVNDHKNMAHIVNGLKGFGEVLTPNSKGLLTNILLIDFNKNFMTASQFCERIQEVPEEELKVLGMKIICKAIPRSKTQIRIICNNTISQKDVELFLKKIRYIVNERKHCNKV